MSSRSAFTLIELLVVITIITLLLALLVPAMEKAMYQAQMAVCGANLRSVGWMANAYAAEHKRRYPTRKIASGPPNALNQVNDAGLPLPADDRPPLKGYIPLNKVFNDPHCEKVDIEGSLPGSQLEIPYQLWWEWKWEGGRAMSKQHDRFTFPRTFSTGSVVYSFNVLASDLDVLNGFGSGSAFYSHPDHGNIGYSLRLQDSVEPGGDPNTGNKYTYTRWQNRNTGKPRGPIDSNFVKGDMSVIRYNHIARDEETRGERLVQVPWVRNPAAMANDFPKRYTHLPRE